MKSKEIMKEARKAGVKVVTRLNSNSVVHRFESVLKRIGVVKPIERTIGGDTFNI